MENAIKKAEEGGWVNKLGEELTKAGIYSVHGIWEQVIMQSTFWEGLGKQQGWLQMKDCCSKEDTGLCVRCKARKFFDERMANPEMDINKFFNRELK